MKKYAILKTDEELYMGRCTICVHDHAISFLLATNPAAIFYFDDLQEAVALLNYIQAVVEDPFVSFLVVAEVELPDEEVTDDA